MADQDRIDGSRPTGGSGKKPLPVAKPLSDWNPPQATPAPSQAPPPSPAPAAPQGTPVPQPTRQGDAPEFSIHTDEPALAQRTAPKRKPAWLIPAIIGGGATVVLLIVVVVVVFGSRDEEVAENKAPEQKAPLKTVEPPAPKDVTPTPVEPLPPAPIEVTGKVEFVDGGSLTLDPQSPGPMVVLKPVDSASGLFELTGAIDSSGSFRLNALGKRGVAPGEYMIDVVYYGKVGNREWKHPDEKIPITLTPSAVTIETSANLVLRLELPEVVVKKEPEIRFHFEKIADTRYTTPSTGAFKFFRNVALDGNNVAFLVTGEKGSAIYAYIDGELVTIADSVTSGGGFGGSNVGLAIQDRQVAFTAKDAEGEGLFLYDDGKLSRIASVSDLPGYDPEKHWGMGLRHDGLLGGNVVFHAGDNRQRSIYARISGKLQLVVDQTMLLPGEDRNFEWFSQVTMGRERIVFLGGWRNRREGGIYERVINRDGSLGEITRLLKLDLTYFKGRLLCRVGEDLVWYNDGELNVLGSGRRRNIDVPSALKGGMTSAGNPVAIGEEFLIFPHRSSVVGRPSETQFHAEVTHEGQVYWRRVLAPGDELDGEKIAEPGRYVLVSGRSFVNVCTLVDGRKAIYLGRCVVSEASQGSEGLPDPPSDAARYSQLPTAHPATNMVLTEDAHFLIVAHENDNQVSVWNAVDGSPVASLECPAPRYFVSRGDATYVANYGHGTVSVISHDTWSVVKTIELGTNKVYHLSAPRGEHFGGKLIATVFGEANTGDYHLLLVDVERGTWREVHARGAELASVDFTGTYYIVQGGFKSTGPGDIEGTYDFKNPPFDRESAREGYNYGRVHGKSPPLYQVRPGDYWYGMQKIRIGAPPRVMAHNVGLLVVPDYSRDVFYIFENDEITCRALDRALTKLGSTKIPSVPVSDMGSIRASPTLKKLRTADHFTVYPIAITVGDDLFLYGLERHDGTVSWCKLPAFDFPPAIEAAAREKVATPHHVPQRLKVGEPLEVVVFKHELPGTYEIHRGGTPSMSISDRGVFQWTPKVAELGEHKIRIADRTVSHQHTYVDLTLQVVKP